MHIGLYLLNQHCIRISHIVEPFQGDVSRHSIIQELLQAPVLARCMSGNEDIHM